MSDAYRTPSPGNRLAHETSPYLLQHAHNPVHWYPWGDEALERARPEDKPIFLSIGYSTCHWCHVMERESFEDPSIAALMNANFVCIKVDREERPDLDEIYMAAVQALTGQGGWPLSVWLAPSLEPFYGGTYFPPDDRFGRPGFPRVLQALADAYRNRPEDVRNSATRLTEALQLLTKLTPGEGSISIDLVDRAYEELLRIFDWEHGGWGSAPKFPRSDFGALALRVYRRTGDERALRMVTLTLDAMSRGGMYDQLGGGFARYSTDDRWLVPHFEKMLYDNAQLAAHYLEAYQLTGRPEYGEVVRGTLDYVLRDLSHPDGAFYGAEDADSEGEEGRFYVWSRAEVEEVLGEELGGLACDYFGISEAGNWEGTNVLERQSSVEQLARAKGLAPEELRSRLQTGAGKLFERRADRVRPHRDEKVLTAWNGLLIDALARAAIALDELRYLDAARRTARFVLNHLHGPRGLLRSWAGGRATLPGYAEDYAMLVRGLLQLYQSSFELEFAEAAIELHDEMFELFGDGADGTLFTTREGEEDLVVRVKTGYDGAIPTANSVACGNALLLHELTGDSRYLQQSRAIVEAFVPLLRERPLMLTHMLLTVDALLADRTELVLAGDPGSKRLRTLLRLARQSYHPDLVIAAAPPDESGDRVATVLPLVREKTGGDPPLAYVCRGFHCLAPTADENELVAQLGGLRSP